MGKLLDIKKPKQGFEFINKSPTTAEIIIYEQIGASFWEDGLSAKAFNDKMKEIPSSVNTIEVRINSLGGDVFDGISIYNRLKQHKAKIKVYIDGLAASIASIIALAGDEVIMGEGALMMIHRASTMVWGNVDDMMKTIDILDEIDEQLVSIYYNKCKRKKSRAEIKNMMSEETWLDASEALEIGFVDAIMEESEKLDIAASLKNAHWIKKMPQMKTCDNEVKEKVKELNNQISEFLAR